MAKEIFRLEGLKDCEAALSELPKATARNVAMRTLKQNGQRVADAGEALAPRLSGGLAESYTVTTKLSRSQRRKNKKESDVEVYIGPTPHAKSVQTEFGNEHQTAHPHLRPAWDAESGNVLVGIVADLRTQIDKAAERMRRKAAKLLAKMKA